MKYPVLKIVIGSILHIIALPLTVLMVIFRASLHCSRVICETLDN